MPNEIIVRLQSPEGTKRVNVPVTMTLYKFFQKVSEAVAIPVDQFKLFADRNRIRELKPTSKVTLNSSKIKHGDMLYVANQTASYDGQADKASTSAASIVEDDVDQFLTKLDGKIYRERDDQLCHHGANAKCVHCVPLEPYDQRYLQEHDPPIKHLSFHSYIRKLTGGVDKGKFAFLDNISLKIKPGCTEHAPWPGGICTKCQPSAITLNRQTYRHVDNLMFENPYMFDRFLDYWRKTGNQRMGFLYGKYEHHKDVPLGIKATVSAIYEPPQRSTVNSLELLPDYNAEAVEFVASKMGLRKVGWIFTDLVADDLTKGTVKHVRNMDAHFLSAEECIMAGEYQNQHPNPCRLAAEGTFGSKFVTCIVTGDVTNQIHTEAYQVSNQCMALVRDNCLVPTRDAPELGYVRESTSEQYVPDVFYTETDSYGNTSKSLARPLPVEFLLVDVTCGFPKDPMYTFNDRTILKHFPVENRSELGELQDLGPLAQYMKQFSGDQFLEAMSDFHLMIYLATLQMLPIREHMGSLLDALRSRDGELAKAWSKSEQWATLEHFMAAQGPSPTSTTATTMAAAGGMSQGTWTCSRCTYINTNSLKAVCEMCEGPKD
ncbi:nuclear protein localization protein 4 homolog [Acanthaster planci]|uniref:Nuclear protein localization protein 4 homolog n=1 Tax=Acanthaster planci TaxID=133434 RepID=A0A8B7ZTL8_ACAPL|nr:nuclear protein localization protein 4 homolog [Acanthaster planci]